MLAAGCENASFFLDHERNPVKAESVLGVQLCSGMNRVPYQYSIRIEQE